jgi:geranylgeranyl diphosphate synthase type II
MDNAPMRRGKPTVHKRWDANTAILSGDSMLVLAFEKMAQCCPDKLKPVIDLFTETALEIGEGQQYDMEFETRSNVTEDEYIEMIRLKTSVLLACALKIGAILADAPDEDAENLYRFGEQIGLAFQLQDDYLDVYGDPKVFGKATGGDILSNKKTYMLINALAKADDNQRKELEQWLAVESEETTGMERTDAQNAKIRAVTDIYNKVGIDRMAQEKINYFFEESKKYLAAVKVPEEKKMMLREYTAKMMRRNK